jgi:hypothetical protein
VVCDLALVLRLAQMGEGLNDMRGMSYHHKWMPISYLIEGGGACDEAGRSTRGVCDFHGQITKGIRIVEGRRNGQSVYPHPVSGSAMLVRQYCQTSPRLSISQKPSLKARP